MMIKKDKQPKYILIAQSIRQKIFSGEYEDGMQLPNEEKFREVFGVSRGTLREAVRLLVDEGLLRRIHGKGTFINRNENSKLFTLTSFDEEILRQNRVPSTRLLKAEVISAKSKIAKKLKIAVGDPVIHIIRLRLADNFPVAYETRYLAESLCPNLLEENLAEASLHSLLVYKFDIPLVKIRHEVELLRLSPKEAELLKADAEATAFSVDRLSYTNIEGKTMPAVWFQALYRQDMYLFSAKAKESL